MSTSVGASVDVASSPSCWDGGDWPKEEKDCYLLEEGRDCERLRTILLNIIKVQASASEHYVNQQIREAFGTNFRTLLGMRRLIRCFETRSMSHEMLDKHFLMTIDWLKTYARRRDMVVKYDISKRGFDYWRVQIIGRLVSQLEWVRLVARSCSGWCR